jgi:dolichyl-phosphate-mannose--protein O-mannosyl transferase
MWRTNAGLTDRHAYDSRPPSWPVMRRGIVSYLIHFSRRVADDRTFGSRIIDRFTLLEILLFGGVVPSLLGYTLPSGVYSFSEKSEDSEIYTNVRSFQLSLDSS